MYPARIVCLSSEPADVIIRLGLADRVVGRSRFVEFDETAGAPIVGNFQKADVDDVLAAEPDLVLGFSDIQHNIAQALVKAGLTVYIANHRSLGDILRYTVQLGSMLGAHEAAMDIAQAGRGALEDLAGSLDGTRVYFEEWDEPATSGIRWISDAIGWLGAVDVCRTLAFAPLAKDREVTTELIAGGAPEVMLASWCGKKVKLENIYRREGWADIPALQNGRVHEVVSPYLLQAGPGFIMEAMPVLRDAISGEAAFTTPGLFENG